MTRRVFIWARKSDGNPWQKEVASPPQFKRDVAEVISPQGHTALQRYARAKLFRRNDSLYLLFDGPKTSLDELDPGKFENTRLLVPSLFGEKVLRYGIALLNKSLGPIADFLPDDTSGWKRDWISSALDRRGWTLLVQRPPNPNRPLPEVSVGKDGDTTGETEMVDVWLNPLVIIFQRENPIPALGPGEFDETPINRAIQSAQQECHALVAEMPIDVQRRAIGWQAIWGDRKGSALSALFNREPARDGNERVFSAPFMDLALLDSFGGTFVAGLEASGSLSWRWRSPDDARPSDEKQQIMEHLCVVLGLELAPKPSDQPSCFNWGVETSNVTRQQNRVPIEDPTDAAKSLYYLAKAVEDLPSGLVLQRILMRFADEAGRMPSGDAETIFRPLLDHSAIEKGHLIADEQTLLRAIQMQFFMPRSNIFVPFKAIERDKDIDVTECFGTSDFSTGIDPFLSPQSPLYLLREVVLDPSDGAGVAAEAHIRSQWYDIFWRYVVSGHNEHAFRLVGGTNIFVVDRAVLDAARLA